MTDTLSADLLSTPFPACFNQGLADGSSRIAVNLVLDPGDSPNTQWQVFPGGLYSHAYTYNSLMRCLLYGLFSGTNGFIPAGTPYVIPVSLPPCVDWCKLNLNIITSVPVNGGTGNLVTKLDLRPHGGYHPQLAAMAHARSSDPYFTGGNGFYGTPISPPANIDQWPDIFLVNNHPLQSQNVPFVGLLAHACSWASQESTPEGCQSDLTFWTFWYGLSQSQKRIGFAYYIKGGPLWMPDLETYRLSSVLAQIDSSVVFGNCLDVSAFLCLSMNSLGAPALFRQVTGIYGYINTNNDICAIGADASNPSLYKGIPWSYHSVVVANAGSGVILAFDACASQKLYWFDDSAYLNPPGSNPLKPWPFDNYWRDSSYIVGLTYNNPWMYYEDYITQNGGSPLFPNIDWYPSVTTQ